MCIPEMNSSSWTGGATVSWSYAREENGTMAGEMTRAPHGTWKLPMGRKYRGRSPSQGWYASSGYIISMSAKLVSKRREN